MQRVVSCCERLVFRLHFFDITVALLGEYEILRDAHVAALDMRRLGHAVSGVQVTSVAAALYVM